MTKSKEMLPYVFLGVLLLIVIFIVGVKYGKRVEQVNKTINYLISLTPTPKPTSPTPIQYLSYVHAGCGLKFLYPSSMKKEGESSSSAVLKSNSGTIDIECKKSNSITTILEDPKVATAEITFKNRKIKGKKTDSTVYFQTANTVKGIMLYVAIDKNLFPLFESTLQFTP